MTDPLPDPPAAILTRPFQFFFDHTGQSLGRALYLGEDEDAQISSAQPCTAKQDSSTQISRTGFRENAFKSGAARPAEII
jgi:hypothetical protein